MKNDTMEPDKEQWIEGVFSSLEGAERAKPSANVWERVEAGIGENEPIRFNSWQRRIAVAAAVVLLAANVFALNSWRISRSGDSEMQANAETYDQSLIAGYNLYE